jgi:serine protease inhibitor
MSELKRDKIKYIRDRAKSAYVKDEECYICGGVETLDFHHFFSVTELLNKWIKERKLVI